MVEAVPGASPSPCAQQARKNYAHHACCRPPSSYTMPAQVIGAVPKSTLEQTLDKYVE